jgi:DNA-binding response OmpR family regulator
MAAHREPSSTILVIDDNNCNCELCRICLETNGFRVHIAKNGKQGLDLIRKCMPDTILLDIMMPVMDGFQVLEEIKADPAIREIPVLVHSACSETATVVSALKMGANDFLKKPFEVAELVIRVEKLVGLKKTRDALVSASVELLERHLAIDQALEKWRLEAEAFRQHCEKSVINILAESNATFKLEQAISSSEQARQLINEIADLSRQRLPEYDFLN